jgi:hypothetical protein
MRGRLIAICIYRRLDWLLWNIAIGHVNLAPEIRFVGIVRFDYNGYRQPLSTTD